MFESDVDPELSFNSDLPFEKRLIASGITAICGTDEAGRGPLAGPVVAAAVVYKDLPILWECRDSKSLLPSRREQLFEILVNSMEYGVGVCSAEEIDHMNILCASLEAMSRAVKQLTQIPMCVLVDGKQRLPMLVHSIPIIKGDARVAVISAASIIAKVTRDRLMREYEIEFPGYGFSKHFGYPTLEHRRALNEHGPCPIHRKSFRGVRELVS